ncbi:hypothetical protein VTI74DRAFT_11003 [Chaetomium olivicolor]
MTWPRVTLKFHGQGSLAEDQRDAPESFVSRIVSAPRSELPSDILLDSHSFPLRNTIAQKSKPTSPS